LNHEWTIQEYFLWDKFFYTTFNYISNKTGNSKF
jgi:hypothetical protein